MRSDAYELIVTDEGKVYMLFGAVDESRLEELVCIIRSLVEMMLTEPTLSEFQINVNSPIFVE